VYVILVYDVSVKRVNKVCQFLRQYLNWIQNSVFEGEITKSEYFIIKETLKKLINEEEDSVIIYILRSENAMKKICIGIEKTDMSHII